MKSSVTSSFQMFMCVKFLLIWTVPGLGIFQIHIILRNKSWRDGLEQFTNQQLWGYQLK